MSKNKCPYKHGGNHFDGKHDRQIHAHKGSGEMRPNRQGNLECPECHYTTVVDGKIDVAFKHCAPHTHDMGGHHNVARDIWDIYFKGQRRGVVYPELLNLFTLHHGPEYYEQRQERRMQMSDIEALISREKGALALKKYAQALCPVREDYKKIVNASVRG